MRSGRGFTGRLLRLAIAVAASALLVAASTGILAYRLTAGVVAAEHVATATETPTAAATAAPTATPEHPFGTGGLPVTPAPLPTEPLAPPVDPRPRFDWPADGIITSILDAEHPLGIDIGASAGAPIYASAGGTVTFAGGKTCCLYGLYVDVDHGDGYLTRYAHLSEISVKESQAVAQGERIGLAGDTGYSFGPHLHFEVLYEGAVQDPLSFLPQLTPQ